MSQDPIRQLATRQRNDTAAALFGERNADLTAKAVAEVEAKRDRGIANVAAGKDWDHVDAAEHSTEQTSSRGDTPADASTPELPATSFDGGARQSTKPAGNPDDALRAMAGLG